MAANHRQGGSPDHWPPEAHLLDHQSPRAWSVKSDIFAAACMFFQLATGHVLLPQASIAARTHVQKHQIQR